MKDVKKNPNTYSIKWTLTCFIIISKLQKWWKSMAIDLVFKVSMLLRNSIGIQKSALTKRSFGFSIQLMFFFTFLLVDIADDQPIRELPSVYRQKWQFSTNQRASGTTSANFRPIIELPAQQVRILNQSESSRCQTSSWWVL